MSEEERRHEWLDWAKVGVLFVAQVIAGAAFVYSLRSDVDYLKKDVSEMKLDVKAFTRAQIQMEASSKVIDVLVSRLDAYSVRLSAIEQSLLARMEAQQNGSVYRNPHK